MSQNWLLISRDCNASCTRVNKLNNINNSLRESACVIKEPLLFSFITEKDKPMLQKQALFVHQIARRDQKKHRSQICKYNEYCTISFNSARGVTCDQVDEILHSATCLIYGARRSRRGLPEPSQTLKMAQKRPVTWDTVSISAKPPKCVARDGRIDRNGTVSLPLTK